MQERQLVVFALGREEFGIEISRVREIVRLQNVTVIPQALEYVTGIVNLRGQIVPIVDLNTRFRITENGNSEEALKRIIVVNMEGQDIGILVDGVSEILRIPEESIDSTPSIMSGGISTDFIEGIAKVADRLIIVLELNRVFDFPGSIVHEE
jgi:purine-binding chemotaxis protein CheW